MTFYSRHTLEDATPLNLSLLPQPPFSCHPRRFTSPNSAPPYKNCFKKFFVSEGVRPNPTKPRWIRPSVVRFANFAKCHDPRAAFTDSTRRTTTNRESAYAASGYGTSTSYHRTYHCYAHYIDDIVAFLSTNLLNPNQAQQAPCQNLYVVQSGCQRLSNKGIDTDVLRVTQINQLYPTTCVCKTSNCTFQKCQILLWLNVS